MNRPLWLCRPARLLALTIILSVVSLTAISCSTSEPSVSPSIKGPVTIPPAEEAPTDNSACSLNEREQQMAHLMANAPGQQRPRLRCHPTLVEVARQRARDMAKRDYFAHTTPDGYGPNYLVRQAGYPLPSRYSQNPRANNVESIGAGYISAKGVWNGLLNSPTHRTHVLGKLPFYAKQVEYGVGYAEGGMYGHYWVVLTATPSSRATAARHNRQSESR